MLKSIPAKGGGVEEIQRRIHQLSPGNDAQRWYQARALQIVADIAEARWRLIEQRGQSSIPKPLLTVMILWFTGIFISFGLLSPRNTTVVSVLVLCGLSLAGAVFLVQELDTPYQGLIRISSTPLRNALEHLGQ